MMLPIAWRLFRMRLSLKTIVGSKKMPNPGKYIKGRLIQQNYRLAAIANWAYGMLIVRKIHLSA